MSHIIGSTWTSYVLRNKQPIVKLFWLAMSGFVIAVPIAYLLPKAELWWSELGEKLGTLAILMFAATSLPGILKRFRVKGVVQQVQIVLMAYRRQTGIAMYLFAFAHYCFQRLFYVLRYQESLISTNTFEIIGSIALLLGMPLFVTSNDYSQQKMGKNWKKVHSLVYIIPWLIFGHVVLINPFEPSTILIGIIAVAEIMSLRADKHFQAA